ncbi:MAG: mechanosensitive ion channel [Nocardioidaceae bacterium]|nr:mechanosensitive ion channel [Nocardioidaceae bacterium]
MLGERGQRGGLHGATVGRVGDAIVRARSTIIYVVTEALVLGRLGVKTTLLTLLAAALLFGGASALALLVGLGGREVAAEVAAGRYQRRIVTVGARIDLDGITGTVVDLRAATTEISTDADGTLHVPYSTLLASPLQVRQQSDAGR